jgi:hypothetical protein
MPDQDRKGLHRQLQASLARDEDEALVPTRLLGRDGGAHRAAGRVADAAVDGLREVPHALGEDGGEDAGLRRARLGDDGVAGLEEGAEALYGGQRSCQ